jgi:hypothetical protein
MKKTYINPTLEVVTLQTIGMLAASLPLSSTEVTDESEVLAPSVGGDFTFDDDAFDFGTEESISSFE